MNIGSRVTWSKAEGHWDKTGFQPTGRIIEECGTIERMGIKDDPAAIVRLEGGNAIRISTVRLRRIYH